MCCDAVFPYGTMIFFPFEVMCFSWCNNILSSAVVLCAVLSGLRRSVGDAAFSCLILSCTGFLILYFLKRAVSGLISNLPSLPVLL